MHASQRTKSYQSMEREKNVTLQSQEFQYRTEEKISYENIVRLVTCTKPNRTELNRIDKLRPAIVMFKSEILFIRLS